MTVSTQSSKACRYGSIEHSRSMARKLHAERMDKEESKPSPWAVFLLKNSGSLGYAIRETPESIDTVESEDLADRVTVYCYPKGVQLLYLFRREGQGHYRLSKVWHRKLHPTRAREILLRKVQSWLMDRQAKRNR